MSLKLSRNLGGGRKTVAAAGTAVQLTTTTADAQWVIVTALTSNTSQVNVGASDVIAAAGATERGVPLLAGDSATLLLDDPSKIYIDSRVTGEGVTYLFGA